MIRWNAAECLLACFAFFTPGSGAASAQSFAPNGPLQATRSNIRDTTVIRVIRGSVWRDTMRIRESLRLGGLDGPQETVFSAISGVAIGKNWEIAVFDESDHRLQVFDRKGRLLRVLGREGAGPGEYRSNTGLVFTSDNGVMQLDPGNSRINRYSGDGASVGSLSVQRVVRGGRGLALDSLDNIYVRSWFPGGAEPIIGFLVYAPDGSRRDSLLPPRAIGQVAPRAWYEPHAIWTLGRGRQWLGGMSSQYSVTIGSTKGIPLRIERSSDPVSFTKDEYRDAVARARANQARRSGYAERSSDEAFYLGCDG